MTLSELKSAVNSYMEREGFIFRVCLCMQNDVRFKGATAEDMARACDWIADRLQARAMNYRAEADKWMDQTDKPRRIQR